MKNLTSLFSLLLLLIALPAQAAAFLSPTEQAVVDELNLLRANPPEYAQKYLMPLRSYYHGNVVEEPGEPRRGSAEGISALNEAIDALLATPSMGAVQASRGMSRAARDHVQEQGAAGGKSHISADGSDSAARMNKYGLWVGSAGEVIAFATDAPRQIIIQLVVDDGVPSRGHRNNLLSPEFKYAGVSIGYHKLLGSMCVIDLAGGYLSDDADKDAILLKAVALDDKEKVKALLEAGGDSNTKSDNGEPLMFEAIARGSTDIVRLLIAHGADVNARDRKGVTPLHIAAERSAGSVELTQLLLDSGAEVNAKDIDGSTPLYWPLYQGYTKTAAALIAKGADVNVRDSRGLTLLHLASMWKKMEGVELLIANGADVNAKDNNGATPLDYAKYNKNQPLTDILQSRITGNR